MKILSVKSIENNKYQISIGGNRDLLEILLKQKPFKIILKDYSKVAGGNGDEGSYIDIDGTIYNKYSSLSVAIEEFKRQEYFKQNNNELHD